MAKKEKAAGYDKYVNYKTFSIAIGAFILFLIAPVPNSMLDVGVEYSQGQKYVLNYFTEKLFNQKCSSC